MAIRINVFADAELNPIRMTLRAGTSPVETVAPGFMAAITRVTLLVDVPGTDSDLVIDSDTAPAGTFDWVTDATTSQVIMFLGRAFTVSGSPAAGQVTVPASVISEGKARFKARFDAYQGSSNAVFAHDARKDIELNLYDKKAGVG